MGTDEKEIADILDFDQSADDVMQRNQFAEMDANSVGTLPGFRETHLYPSRATH